MKPVQTRSHPWLLTIAMVAALAVLAAACSSDDGADDDAATTSAEEEEAPAVDEEEPAADDEPTTEAASADDDVAEEEPATDDQPATEEADTADGDDLCQGQDGTGLKVGFANLGESVPFAVSVREGMEAMAAECGLELVTADNQLDPQIALDNARNFVAQQVDGVVEFQVAGDISASLCEILGDLPVIAIDIAHPECAVFMGADNRTAGFLAGEGVGQVAQERWDCQIDQIVTFEGFGVGDVNVQRLNGAIEGLQSVCPDLEYGDYDNWAPEVPDSIITRLDADRVDPAFTQGRDYLTAHPDAERIVALCINDDSCLGFQSAVQESGREGQVLFASQGADQSVWEEIRTDENYIGSTAYFPERYAELIVPNIIRMINGEEPESDPLLIDHLFLTADNIDEHYPE